MYTNVSNIEVIELLNPDIPEKPSIFLKLREAHTFLIEVSQELCDLYSLPIFLSIAVYTISFLKQCQVFIDGNVRENKNAIVDLVMPLIFFFDIVFMLILLTKSARSTITESKKVDLTLIDCLMYNDNVKDKHALYQLVLFANQCMSTDLRFAAINAFVLKESLLVKMISTVISYFVIYYQFHPDS
ncbi:uncharacterized protein LOC106636777 [Copidosoma floridanum]|uniref:uncharacterized protein LOC106636777 n=1 Tax=Copidosoma floridanum TaxID=29053 RepID=UPI0006C95DF6|nr:uncharacterized protein LOC106636777 [Copidosoma floridanum]